MDFLVNLNLLVLILIIVTAFKMVDGYKKGMVKEIISFVSIIIACMVVALIANGIHNYQGGHFANVVIVVLLLAVIGVIHSVLRIVFFSVKLISKLPIVHWADKLLGVVVGAAEVILLLWTVYLFTMMMDLGSVGQMIIGCTKSNSILVWLYEHNYLAHFLEGISDDFSKISFDKISEIILLTK